MNQKILPALLLLAPSVMLHALGMDIFVSCVPIMASSFQCEFSLVQWVLSAFVLGTGIGQIFVGPLADRYGRRVVMVVSILLFFVSSIFCAVATSLSVLITARFFQGLASCGTTVASLAIVRDQFCDQTRPKMYSYLNGIVALAPMLAPLLGGYLFVWSGTWRATFYFLTVFSLLALLISVRYLQETQPVVQSLQFKTLVKRYITILSNKRFLTFVTAAVSGLAALFLFFSISSILLIDYLDVLPEHFGFYFGLNAISYLIASLVSPRLQPKHGLRRVALLGASLIIFGAVGMVLWHQLHGLTIYGLMLPNLVMAFGVGLLFGPSTASALLPFKDYAGTASAAYGTLQYSGAALIGALVMQFPINTTLPLAVTMVFLGMVTWFVLFRFNEISN